MSGVVAISSGERVRSSSPTTCSGATPAATYARWLRSSLRPQPRGAAILPSLAPRQAGTCKRSRRGVLWPAANAARSGTWRRRIYAEAVARPSRLAAGPPTFHACASTTPIVAGARRRRMIPKTHSLHPRNDGGCWCARSGPLASNARPWAIPCCGSELSRVTSAGLGAIRRFA